MKASPQIFITEASLNARKSSVLRCHISLLMQPQENRCTFQLRSFHKLN